MPKDSLEKYRKAHRKNYATALKEIRNGRKQSHWMWYIFPQIKGLGHSYNARYYAISNMEEARAYMEDAVLREHMLEICKALLNTESSDPAAVMGVPDNMKLMSSMTLFGISNPEYDIFQKVLDKFFFGQKDIRTIEILTTPGRNGSV